MNLQYKWDVMLLTAFFTNPSYKMAWIVEKFRIKYDVTNEQIFELLRTPRRKRHLNIPVEVFWGSYIPRIGRGLYDKTVEDVFDIAEKLKHSKTDTVWKQREIQDKEVVQARKDYRKWAIESGMSAAVAEKSARRAWGVTKA